MSTPPRDISSLSYGTPMPNKTLVNDLEKFVKSIQRKQARTGLPVDERVSSTGTVIWSVGSSDYPSPSKEERLNNRIRELLRGANTSSVQSQREKAANAGRTPPRKPSSAAAAAAAALPSVLSSPAVSSLDNSSSSEGPKGSESSSFFADQHSAIGENPSAAAVAAVVDDVAKTALPAAPSATDVPTPATSVVRTTTPPPAREPSPRTPPPERMRESPAQQLVFDEKPADTPTLATAAAQPLPDDSFFSDEDRVSPKASTTASDESMKDIGESSPEPTPAASPAPPLSSAAAAAVSSSEAPGGEAEVKPVEPAAVAPEALRLADEAADEAVSGFAGAPVAPAAPSASAVSEAPVLAPVPADEEPRVREAPVLTHRIVRVNRPLWIATSILSSLSLVGSTVAAGLIAFAVETPFLASAVAFLGGPTVAVPIMAGLAIGSIATFVISCLKLKKRLAPIA